MHRNIRKGPGEEPNALFLGPGARLAALRPILAALSGPTRTVRSIEPLDALGELEGERGTLLLDADLLALEDLGWLRRLFVSRPGLRLVLIGDDPSRRCPRALLRLAQARWTSWPPDVEDLESIVGQASAPPAGLVKETDAGPAPRRAERMPFAAEAQGTRASSDHALGGPAARRAAFDDELAEIEALLEMPSAAERLGPREQSRESERELAAAYILDARVPKANVGTPSTEPVADARSASPTSIAAGETRTPKHFRDQVADLADIAQRIELSLEAIEDASAPERVTKGWLDPLRGDVARLVQFTRTLGYLVASPPPGAQVFDLGETIRVIVAGLAARGAESPRCLLRGVGTLIVRSDRQLLEQAFDAFFGLIRCAARTGEVVRIQWRSEANLAQITIEFPAGPLKDLTPAEIVEPYGLRKRAPELGANALSAAIAILRGQGGEAALCKTPAGRLEWRVTLPHYVEARHDEPTLQAVSEMDAASIARPEDPFA